METPTETNLITENTEEEWIFHDELTLISECLFLGSEAKEVCHVLLIGREDTEWIVR